MIPQDRNTCDPKGERGKSSYTAPHYGCYAAVLAATLVLALLLRLWNLGGASLWYDEAMYGWLAKGFHPGLLSGRFILVEPLFVWPLSWWVQWSDAAWWLRFPSVIAGVLTVYVGTSTANMVAGKRAALCTALLLAVAPALLYYSRDAKMYAWVFLWLMCVIRATLAFAATPDRLRPLFLYVVAGTALCYTHFAAPIFLAVSGLGFLVCFARTFRVMVRWIFANALIVLLAVPFIVAELRYQSAMQDYLFHAYPPDLYSLYIVLAHFFTAYTTSDTLLMAATLLLSALILFGLVRGHGLRAPMVFLIMLGVAPALILFVLSSLAPWSLFVDRYVMASSLPLLIAASIALTLKGNRMVFIVGLLFCILLSALALPDVYHHALPKDFRQRKGLIARPDAARMADILRERAREGDTVLHPSWETEPVLKWYAPEFHHVLADYQNSMVNALTNLASPEYLAFYGWNPVDVRRVAASLSRAWLVLPASDDSLGSCHSGVVEELVRRGTRVFSEACGAAILQCYDLSGSENIPGWPCKTAQITFPKALGGGNLDFLLDPAGHAEEAAFELTLKNHTERNVVFQFETVPCDIAVPGSALRPRMDAESAWSHGPYPAARACRMAAQFRVHPKVHQGDDLEACFRLPSGVYEVCLERTTEGSTYTIPAAALHIEITGQQSDAFTSSGSDTGAVGGWTWERLGVVRIGGDHTGIVVSADDPRQRPEAYAVLSQVVLIRKEPAPSVLSGPTVLREYVACPPGDSITKLLSSGGHANCLLVQGTVMDACVCLINGRTDITALLPYEDCR